MFNFLVGLVIGIWGAQAYRESQAKLAAQARAAQETAQRHAQPWIF